MYQIPQTITNPYLFSYEALTAEIDFVTSEIARLQALQKYWANKMLSLCREGRYAIQSGDDEYLTPEGQAVDNQIEKYSDLIENLLNCFDTLQAKFEKITQSREQELYYNLANQYLWLKNRVKNTK